MVPEAIRESHDDAGSGAYNDLKEGIDFRDHYGGYFIREPFPYRNL